MAAGALAGDVRMVESTDHPAHLRVAVFANVTGRNMAGRFADCGLAVVAGGAGTAHLGVVEADTLPGRGRMAGFADGARRDVRSRFASGSDTVVATAALLGCALENGVLVAALTVHPGMGAAEWKAGPEVIKASFNTGGRGRLNDRRAPAKAIGLGAHHTPPSRNGKEGDDGHNP